MRAGLLPTICALRAAHEQFVAMLRVLLDHGCTCLEKAAGMPTEAASARGQRTGLLNSSKVSGIETGNRSVLGDLCLMKRASAVVTGLQWLAVDWSGRRFEGLMNTCMPHTCKSLETAMHSVHDMQAFQDLPCRPTPCRTLKQCSSCVCGLFLLNSCGKDMSIRYTCICRMYVPQPITQKSSSLVGQVCCERGVTDLQAGEQWSRFRASLTPHLCCRLLLQLVSWRRMCWIGQQTCHPDRTYNNDANAIATYSRSLQDLAA